MTDETLGATAELPESPLTVVEVTQTALMTIPVSPGVYRITNAQG